MGVIAQDQITLTDLTDVAYIKTWYRLATSVPTAPTNRHTSGNPSGHDAKTGWVSNEPAYDGDYNLYTVEQNVFGDNSCVWGTVQLSSVYNIVMHAVDAVDLAIISNERYYYGTIQPAQPSAPSEGSHSGWSTTRPTWQTSSDGYIWYSDRVERNDGEITWSPVGHIISSRNLEILRDSIMSTVESTYIDENGLAEYTSSIRQTAEAVTATFGANLQYAVVQDDLDAVETIANSASSTASSAASVASSAYGRAGQAISDASDARMVATTYIHESVNGIVVGKDNSNVAAYINANGSFDIKSVQWSGSPPSPSLGTTLSSFQANEIALGSSNALINLCNGAANIIGYGGDTGNGFYLETGKANNMREYVSIIAGNGDAGVREANLYLYTRYGSSGSVVESSAGIEGNMIQFETSNYMDGGSTSYIGMGYSSGEAKQYIAITSPNVEVNGKLTVNGDGFLYSHDTTQTTSITNCTEDGLYRYSSNVSDKPGSTSTAGVVLTLPYSSTYSHQLAFRNNAGSGQLAKAYIRMKNSYNWSSWLRLLDEADIDQNVAMKNHGHTEYSLTSHTHSGYALSTHTHSGYASSTHTHKAGDITSGKLGVDFISTGTTSTTVALGNHTHSSLNNSSYTAGLTSNSHFRLNNNGVGSLGTTTNRWNNVLITGEVNVSSDLKVKDVLGEIDFAENLIMSITPVVYMRKDGDHRRSRMGFIAQDVSEKCKKLGQNLALYTASYVSGDEKFEEDYFGEDVDDERLTWGLSYEQLIAPIVAVIQSQNKRINELEQKLESLTK